MNDAKKTWMMVDTIYLAEALNGIVEAISLHAEAIGIVGGNAEKALGDGCWLAEGWDPELNGAAELLELARSAIRSLVQKEITDPVD